MSEVAKLEHGDFVWDELTSTDAAKAASFYCGLLGWKTEEMPMGEMGTYTLCMNEGGMIGGIMGMPPMVPEGTPSHWGSYIYVDNAEEAFAKATSLGATPIVPPSPIPNVGTFAMMQDTAGAMFSVLGPNEEVPAQEDGKLRDTSLPSAFAWHEMMTPDAAKTREFYTALFGWDVIEMPTETPDGKTFTYYIFTNRGKHTGGIVQMNEEEQKMGIPPHWGRYIRVENADKAIAKAEELGGSKCHDAFDIPTWGRIGLLNDPTGATFGVFQGFDGH
ncbi:MAG: VOC family protein [Planctomycetes bacterium]|nr:VOC family protein [Planctomycetota bacterium]